MRITAKKALTMLMDGNRRYATHRTTDPNQTGTRRISVADGQEPFAVVFSCADSRVPPEIIFDRGLGDLFVVRTAGHVLDNVVVGSIEYGAEHLHIPIVMVLGHERCGAVQAALDVANGADHPTTEVAFLTRKIGPAVRRARKSPGAWIDNAVRENVRETMANLLKSHVLAHLVEKRKLRIVGGVYDLDTGVVSLV